jgi:hypothetical protein
VAFCENYNGFAKNRVHPGTTCGVLQKTIYKKTEFRLLMVNSMRKLQWVFCKTQRFFLKELMVFIETTDSFKKQEIFEKETCGVLYKTNGLQQEN